MRSDPTGVVFDIKELAVFDGPGLRCTVFFKGCPLGCSWCHNPEGLDLDPEFMRTAVGSREVGRYYRASELAEKLLSYAPVFAGTEGGITFSGGEPLMQADFLMAVMRLLKGKMHLLLQTSGYAPPDIFQEAAALADLVYFDFKIADPEEHEKYTGRDNGPILDNLIWLDRSGFPYRIRMPLIPGVTDTPENYQGIREFIQNHLLAGNNLGGIDLLPYNRAAGGKYQAVGRVFDPGYDENRDVSIRPDYFKGLVREVKAL